MVPVVVPPGVIERIVEVLGPEDLMAILPDGAPDRDLDRYCVERASRARAHARRSDSDAAS